MSSLYQLTNEYIQLKLMAQDPEADEINAETYADTFEGLEGEYEDKCESWMKVVQDIKGENAALKASCEGVNLAEVFIVSSCAWEAPEEGAEVGNGTNYPELTIAVSEAKGAKCPRCWMHSEKAGADDLCPRCAAVVAKLDVEM